MSAPLSIGLEVAGDRSSPADPPAADIAALAHRLEAAGVSYWIIGAGRGEPAARGPATRPPVTLDPTVVATVAARHSTRLGIVVAAAGHRDHPYNLARRLVSVDHAAGGRVGWLALDRDHGTALNAATDTWTGAALDAIHTAHAIAAVRTLWRTWPLDSIVGDRESGTFADIAAIRRADVRNGYAIAGPLNVPGSVQGDLPVWQQATTDGGHDVDGADLVIVEDGEPPPVDTRTVVRLRSVPAAHAALERLTATPGVVGAVLRVEPAQLDLVLDRLLPAARARGLIGESAAATLRERLGLPPRTEPDLSDNTPAFDVPARPGVRL